MAAGNFFQESDRVEPLQCFESLLGAWWSPGLEDSGQDSWMAARITASLNLLLAQGRQGQEKLDLQSVPGPSHTCNANPDWLGLLPYTETDPQM